MAKQKNKRNNKKGYTIIIFILIFLISFILDKFVFSLMNYLRNPIFDYVFMLITSFVFIGAVLIFATLMLVKEKKKSGISVLWLSILISSIICFLLKNLIMRPRPEILAVAIPLIELGYYSFPSLHATIVFSVIPVLCNVFARFRWFWLIFALLVAFSRIYLNVHYLSDVVGGALLGYVIGVIVLNYEEKHKLFKKWL